MRFSAIPGQEHIKKQLLASSSGNRIAHAQLFVGKEGSGTLAMALAYARTLLCVGGSIEDDCNKKYTSFSHPDLHFAYPVATSDKVKSHPISENYIGEWRNFLSENLYASLYDWYQYIGIEKKQGQIGVDEAHQMVKKLSLKSYEGGNKVMIVWMLEKMNTSAANKLLKLIEEPPKNTIFIFIAEKQELLLDTIISRCQITNFPPLSEDSLHKHLINKGLDSNLALKIARQSEGNLNRALFLSQGTLDENIFEKWFIQWVRTAFQAKGNKSSILELTRWAEEIAKSGKEIQKKFLEYSLELMRQALLLNYSLKELVTYDLSASGFDIAKFAPFIHEGNGTEIQKVLEEALYHIERNGNSKLIFTDLSIKLTRLLHVKAKPI